MTEIGSLAFHGCSRLTSVTLPDSVASIGDGAFKDCDGLTSIVSLIQEPDDISKTVFCIFDDFYFIYNRAILYVPEGTADKYKTKEGWKEFKNIVDGIPSSITLLGNEESEPAETERYDLNGNRIATPQRGINVVKMSDGTVKKEFVK